MKLTTIREFHDTLPPKDQAICDALWIAIDNDLPGAESKIWHAHPVWFLNGNPIVGYSKLKGSIRLMFWSGIDFGEPDLKAGTGKFKDVSIRYDNLEDINLEDLTRWLTKGQNIQWDYKNIYKRKGKLVRLV